MKNQKVVKINDKAYLINAFKGRMGWSYLPRLTKYIFPFVTFLFDQEKSEEDAIPILMELLSGDNAKDVENIIIEMVENVQVDGMEIDFNDEFAQNYDALLLLFVEVIKLNYYESFQRLATNLPKE